MITSNLRPNANTLQSRPQMQYLYVVDLYDTNGCSSWLSTECELLVNKNGTTQQFQCQHSKAEIEVQLT